MSLKFSIKSSGTSTVFDSLLLIYTNHIFTFFTTASSIGLSTIWNTLHKCCRVHIYFLQTFLILVRCNLDLILHILNGSQSSSSNIKFFVEMCSDHTNEGHLYNLFLYIIDRYLLHNFYNLECWDHCHSKILKLRQQHVYNHTNLLGVISYLKHYCFASMCVGGISNHLPLL